MSGINNQKTVSLVLYITTVVILIIINVVAVTAAILTRPTEEKVKIMINEQFQEQSYLGQKLKNIETQMGDMQQQLKEFQKETKKK